MLNELKSKQIDHQIAFTVSYLACPYAHADPQVKLFRHKLVNYYTQQYLLKGQLVYSPLTHNIPLHPTDIEQTWDIWSTFDKAMLARCNTLIVLQTDGWQQSVGVTAEIEFAKTLYLPITFLQPDTQIIKNCEVS